MYATITYLHGMHAVPLVNGIEPLVHALHARCQHKPYYRWAQWYTLTHNPQVFPAVAANAVLGCIYGVCAQQVYSKRAAKT